MGLGEGLGEGSYRSIISSGATREGGRCLDEGETGGETWARLRRGPRRDKGWGRDKVEGKTRARRRGGGDGGAGEACNIEQHRKTINGVQLNDTATPRQVTVPHLKRHRVTSHISY